MHECNLAPRHRRRIGKRNGGSGRTSLGTVGAHHTVQKKKGRDSVGLFPQGVHYSVYGVPKDLRGHPYLDIINPKPNKALLPRRVAQPNSEAPLTKYRVSSAPTKDRSQLFLVLTSSSPGPSSGRSSRRRSPPSSSSPPSCPSWGPEPAPPEPGPRASGPGPGPPGPAPPGRK